MKVAVVGGGSTYTPELADGVARLRSIVNVEELALIDPDVSRLSVVGPFSSRLFAHHGHPGRVTWTSNLEEGLDGADVVLIQLRVGGQAARITDEKIPQECSCVGQETTGAGGLGKALRTVPVVLDVASKVPSDTWIIDFTNPVGIVTRALLDAGHRAVGLCNVAIGFQRHMAAALGVEPDAVLLDHIGLNHLTWERSAWIDGVDRLPDLLTGDWNFPASLVQSLGAIPSYYLRYFYHHDEVVAEEKGQPTRGERVLEIEAALLEMYADPALDTKPDLLMQRGGAYYSEAALGLIASLYGGQPGVHSANVRNNGLMPFLADDAVVEVMCDVSAPGPVARPIAPVSPTMSGLIAAVSAYEELAIDAALRGGRERVYRALLAHPLIGQHDLASQLADRLLAENAEFLA
jgi:6-phospho-beta-glucosidase